MSGMKTSSSGTKRRRIGFSDIAAIFPNLLDFPDTGNPDGLLAKTSTSGGGKAFSSSSNEKGTKTTSSGKRLLARSV